MHAIAKYKLLSKANILLFYLILFQRLWNFRAAYKNQAKLSIFFRIRYDPEITRK